MNSSELFSLQQALERLLHLYMRWSEQMLVDVLLPTWKQQRRVDTNLLHITLVEVRADIYCVRADIGL